MPIPKRQAIREAIKNILIANTDCGASVYTNRASAFIRSELPCISIFSKDESLSPRDTANKSYVRKLNIIIEIHAEDNEDLDDRLDVINDQIEALLLADPSLQGTVQGLIFTDIEIDISNDPAVDVGALTLTTQVTYTK